MIELTRLTKIGGPLTKRIELSADGKLISEGSACIMSSGCAQRARFDRLDDVAQLIQSLGSHEAIALGSLDPFTRPSRGNNARQTGEDEWLAAPAGLVARNSNHVSYRPGQPALALLDVDAKGMPAAVRAGSKEFGALAGAGIRRAGAGDGWPDYSAIDQRRSQPSRYR